MNGNSLKHAIKSSVMAGALAFSFAAALPATQPVQAIDWAGLAGAGVQYIELEKELKYLDNQGRNEFFEQLKQKYGVNTDPQANAMLDRIMTRLSASIAKSDPSITKNRTITSSITTRALTPSVPSDITSASTSALLNRSIIMKTKSPSFSPMNWVTAKKAIPFRAFVNKCLSFWQARPSAATIQAGSWPAFWRKSARQN